MKIETLLAHDDLISGIIDELTALQFSKELLRRVWTEHCMGEIKLPAKLENEIAEFFGK
jgi:hypothetical protein